MTILILQQPAWLIPPILALAAMAIWSVAWAVFSVYYDTPKPALVLPRDRGQYIGRHRVERHRQVDNIADLEPRPKPTVDELEKYHEGHEGRPTAGCPGCEAVETAGATA